MKSRKTQKESTKGTQCQNPNPSCHKGEGAKEVTKELKELFEGKV